MNTIDFTKAGGFLLEQEAFELMQDAYRKDFFEAFCRQTGWSSNKNYLLAPATATDTGWIAIQGELVPVHPSSASLPVLEVITYRRALEFGSGISEKIYTHREARYVEVVPNPLPSPIETIEERMEKSYFEVEDLTRPLHIPDLHRHLMPLDGSEVMRGNLNMGGHWISRLDVNEQPQATIRTSGLWLGESAQHPANRPVGKVVTDQSNTLAFNERTDWEHTLLHGQVRLENVMDQPTPDLAPLLTDKAGNLSGGDANYIGGVPLGLILLWSKQVSIPYGWVLCDGNSGVPVNGEEIPDLSNRFIGDVCYIIYVRYPNRPPEDLEISGETTVSYTASTGGATARLVATAKDPDGDDLTYKWSKEFGDGPDLGEVEGVELLLSGLRQGQHQFRVEATDTGGQSVQAIVPVMVKLQPELSIEKTFEGSPIATELYDVTITGAANAALTLEVWIAPESSDGAAFYDIHEINGTGKQEFPIELDATGTMIHTVVLDATAPGDIILYVAIKGQSGDGSKVKAIARLEN